MDNDCSRHMTEDRNCFLSFRGGGSITYDNEFKFKIKGINIICKNHYTKIEDVQYVEGLKYSLLNISQLCHWLWSYFQT